MPASTLIVKEPSSSVSRDCVLGSDYVTVITFPGGVRECMEESYGLARHMDHGQFWAAVVGDGDHRGLLCESFIGRMKASLGTPDEPALAARLARRNLKRRKSQAEDPEDQDPGNDHNDTATTNNGNGLLTGR